MYCKKCGSVLNDGAVFCPNCGQTMAAKTSAPAAGAYAQPVQPQPGYGYYGSPQYKTQGASVKGLFAFAMAVLLVILAVGLMEFPVIKFGKDWFYAIGANSNGDMFISYLYDADGNIFEAFSDFIDHEELAGVCIVISLVMMCVSILAAVIGAFCSLIKNYSAAILMTGIGMLIAVLGYIANIIEGIYLISENNDYEFKFSNCYISTVPPAMLVVCLVFAVVSFIAAGRMRNSD